jgi:hypothetical protein
MNATANGKDTHIDYISHDFDELILEDDDTTIAGEQYFVTACS